MNILNSAPSFNKLRESFVWFLQTLHVQPSISCTYTFCLLFCETRFICFMLWICYYGYLNPSGGRQAYQKAIYSYRLSTWWLVRCTKAFIFLLAFLSINVTLSWNFCNQLMHYSKIIAPTCPHPVIWASLYWIFPVILRSRLVSLGKQRLVIKAQFNYHRLTGHTDWRKGKYVDKICRFVFQPELLELKFAF